MLVQSVDIAELEEWLPKLVNSYRDALKKVEQLPAFGRTNTIIYTKCSELEEPLMEKLGHQWVFRAVVRLFVESHIRAKLEEIIRHLRIERMTIADNSNDRIKKIEFYIDQLEQFSQSMHSWSHLNTVIFRLLSPVVYLTVIILTAGYTNQLIQSIELPNLSSIFNILGLVLLFSYIILVPIIIINSLSARLSSNIIFFTFLSHQT